MPNNISTYITAITKHKNNWLHEGQQTDRGRHRGRHRAVCVLGLLHTSENAHIKRFMVTTTLTLISLVSHGRRNHKTFDSSKKIIWKTEVKAKVQDCEQYFCERVSYSSSHEPLQTFSQWFQPKGFAHSLHAYYLCHCIYIYIYYIILFILLSVVSSILSVCVSTVSLRECQIPTFGKGTLASVTDGKGTLQRRLQTERESTHCNVRPSLAMFDLHSGCSSSPFIPV